jgi:hypothetical protein
MCFHRGVSQSPNFATISRETLWRLYNASSQESSMIYSSESQRHHQDWKLRYMTKIWMSLEGIWRTPRSPTMRRILGMS